MFDGRTYLMETALKGDFGLVKAWRADPFGNLQFRGTAMNFNPECAKAGRYTIVEAEELVPAGAMDPMEVHLPGIFVSAIVKTDHEKPVAVSLSCWSWSFDWMRFGFVRFRLSSPDLKVLPLFPAKLP